MADAITLADLLPERIGRLDKEAKKALCSDSDISSMKLAWDHVSDRIIDALRTALDCDLIDALAGGWVRTRALADAADRQAAGEPVTVELGKHEIGHEIRPVVVVTIAPCPSLELEFTFAVTAKFGGVSLDIADGHLVGGRPGEAWASAVLSFGGVALHDAADSRRLKLPGQFRLAEPGLKIPGLRAAAVAGTGGAAAG